MRGADMEQRIQSSCETRDSGAKVRAGQAWAVKDMFGHSDLVWDSERETDYLTWQLNFALRAIEEREVNLLKWHFELLLNAIEIVEMSA
jgi:hypothetical protein